MKAPLAFCIVIALCCLGLTQSCSNAYLNQRLPDDLPTKDRAYKPCETLTGDVLDHCLATRGK
jgi:hypothetical protein